MFRLATKQRKMRKTKTKRKEYSWYAFTSSPPEHYRELIERNVIVRRYDTVQHRVRRTSHQPLRRTFREHYPRPDRHPKGRSTH